MRMKKTPRTNQQFGSPKPAKVLDSQPSWRYTSAAGRWPLRCPPRPTGAQRLCLTDSHRPVHAGSLSTFQNCSLTSVGSVLKRSSSTTRPVLFSCRHSLSSTGRHSRRFPLSSSCVSAVSSPNRDGRDCRQLFPKLSVRSFLH